MKIRAAVAWEAAKPLVIEELDLEGPKQGEVLVRLAAGNRPSGSRPESVGYFASMQAWQSDAGSISIERATASTGR